MVLRSALLVLLAACSQSLFDNNPNKDGGTGGEMTVANMCTAPCVGDAAADFDGTPGGANGRWRYVEDLKNRTWTPMTLEAASGTMIGTVETANTVGKCAASSTEHACQSLPGALLVGASAATAEPAIELKAPMNQVVQISLKVAVPPGAGDHTVRLYRNSREDVLFTGMALAANTLETTITIDALANDRILMSLSATAAVQNVGVQLFVSGTGATFPENCQLALAFSEAMGMGVDNLCGGDFTYANWETSMMETPTLTAGPFPEQGMAADIMIDRYYKGTNLVLRNADSTLQFWVRHDMFDPLYDAWVFSDLDLDSTGGLGVVIFDNGGPKMEVTTCTGAGNPLTFAGDMMPYPADNAWHFVRFVQKGGLVNVCFDGEKKFSFAAAAGSLASQFRPHMGRNVVWTPSFAKTDAAMDDLRIFTGALPCE